MAQQPKQLSARFDDRIDISLGLVWGTTIRAFWRLLSAPPEGPKD
jgi:hypothetical protein